MLRQQRLLPLKKLLRGLLLLILVLLVLLVLLPLLLVLLPLPLLLLLKGGVAPVNTNVNTSTRVNLVVESKV
jgi:hypothetical protein